MKQETKTVIKNILKAVALYLSALVLDLIAFAGLKEGWSILVAIPLLLLSFFCCYRLAVNENKHKYGM